MATRNAINDEKIALNGVNKQEIIRLQSKQSSRKSGHANTINQDISKQ